MNKTIFDYGTEFKKNFINLLFSVKHVPTTFKKPHSNSILVQHIYQVQVIDNMIKIQQLEDQAFDYCDPFGEIIDSVDGLP